jgi:hypothetical protein
MVNDMDKKMPRYQLGGLMTTQQRANKQVNRDLDRDLPPPTPFSPGIAGLVPQELLPSDKKARLKRMKQNRLDSMRTKVREQDRDRARQLLMSRRREEKIKRPIAPRRARMSQMGIRRASGGIVGFQEGGVTTRGYTPSSSLPANYGGMTAYQGYGMPGQFEQRRSYVAPELASQYADITQAIMQTGTRPYEQTRYTGPHLAGFTPEEEAYRAAVTRIGTGEGPRATRQAEQTIGEAARGIGSVATAAGAPSLLKDADLSPYESQYTQGVIDPQIRAIREAARQQAAELGSSAAQAGAFGGYRHGLQEQAIGQQEIQQIGDVTAKGAEEAFRSAQAAQQKDAAAEAAAREQQMSAFGRLGGMGSSQMQLGQQMGADQMRRLEAMRGAGMDARKMQQTAFDIQKSEFEKQMQYPEKQLQFMTGMLGQLPYENIQTAGTYTPQAGPMSSMIGAGIHGVGMADAYARQQQQGPPMPPITDPASGMTNPAANPVASTNTVSTPNVMPTTVAPVNQYPGFGGNPINPNQTAQNMFGTNITVPAATNYGGGLLSRAGGGMMPHMMGGIAANNYARLLNRG